MPTEQVNTPKKHYKVGKVFVVRVTGGTVQSSTTRGAGRGNGGISGLKVQRPNLTCPFFMVGQ